jgi:hypothetical protein
VVAALLLVGVVEATVAASDTSVGTSGAAFLKVPVGATATVVPDIVAGMRPDASMLFTNPSNLSRISDRELFLTTSNWLDEFNLSAASLSLPVRSLGLTWSTGARLLYMGDLKGYDATGQVVADERYYDLAVSSGVGTSFDDIGVSLGADVTYIREHLAVEDGDGLTFALGASYAHGGHRLGVSAQDLGGNLEFADRGYEIDSRYLVGYGHVFREAWGSMMLGAEATFSRGEFDRVDAGVSYGFNRYLTLMSGFGHSNTTATGNDMPIRAGLSVQVGDMSVDYAYAPQQYFSDTHTFSVRFAFRGNGDWESRDIAAPYPSGPISQPVSTAAPEVAPAPGKAVPAYLIVAGTHASLESAEAEARALRLLKIPARAQSVGSRFRVVVDRYDTQPEAAQALREFRNKGHEFAIIVVGD